MELNQTNKNDDVEIYVRDQHIINIPITEWNKNSLPLDNHRQKNKDFDNISKIEKNDKNNKFFKQTITSKKYIANNFN